MADVFKNLGFEEEKAPSALASDPFASLGFEEETQSPSTLEALGRSAVQGLTGGFGDEIIGAVHSPMGAVKSVAGLLGKDVSGDTDVANYAKARDANRSANEAAFKAHPYASIAGTVAGSIPLTIATGGLGEAAGLGELGAVSRGAVQSAADAGLMGAGSTNADLTRGDVGQFAKDVGKSSAAGFGVGGIAGKIGNALRPTNLRETATDLAVKHLRPTPAMTRAIGKEGVRDAAREALDSGAIQWGTKADQTAENLNNLVNEVGATKGAMVEASTGKADPIAIADKFDREVIAPLRGTSENAPVVKMLEEKKQAFLDTYAPGYKSGGRAPGTPTTITRKSQFVPQDPTTDFGAGTMKVGERSTFPNADVDVVKSTIPEAHGYGTKVNQELRVIPGEEVKEPIYGYSTPEQGQPFQTDPRTGLPVKQVSETRIEGVPEVTPMSASQVEAEKSAVNDNINWKQDTDARIGGQRGWSRVLKEAGEDAVDDPNFTRVKDAYGNLANASSMADRTGSLTDGGGLLGHLTDVGVGTEALREIANGNPAGLAVAGVRAATKGRLSSSGAVTLDGLANLLEKTPQVFGKFGPVLRNAASRGPQALAATHYILSQSNPEYQATTQGLSGQGQ